MRPLLSHLAWLKNLLCYMIHYGTYRGAVVGLRGAVVGVRGAAVGNIGIPTYVISRGAVVRQPKYELARLATRFVDSFDFVHTNVVFTRFILARRFNNVQSKLF